MDKILLYSLLLATCHQSQVNARYCSLVNDLLHGSDTVICNGGIDLMRVSYFSSTNVTLQIENYTTIELTTSFFYDLEWASRKLVRRIKGVNNNWHKLHSSLFQSFINLKIIDISGNKINIISDFTFKGLSQLQVLNISRNSIDKITRNTFFIAYNINDNSLEVLDLSYNSLKSISTGTFCSLPKLQTLYLNNNKIIELQHGTFNCLNNLYSLSLRENGIKYLNEVFNSLQTVTTLDISFNSLERLAKYEIYPLKSLITFNVSYNAIKTVDTNCFDQAVNLSSLDLSHNKIISRITASTFSNNNKLSYLNLCNNFINFQPEEFKNKNMSYLNLNDNIFEGVINEYKLSNLSDISLNFNNTGIKVVKNYAFSGSLLLSNLNLSENVINTIEEHAMDLLPSLKIIDISHNNISNINFLRNCCFNITELYINDNKLEILPKHIFQNHTYVTKLDISMNSIFVIKQYTLPLNNLKHLNVKGNVFTAPIQSRVFTPSNYIGALDLSNMNITAILSEAFVDSPLLERLNLSHNQISTVDTNNFAGLKALDILDISHNNLARLHISNNISLVALKSAFINNNNMTCMPSIIATSLVDLRLSSNKIDDLNLSNFTKLLKLDVSDNKLRYLNNSILNNVQELQYFDVSENNIDDLPPGTFHGITGLKYLNMSGNNLTQLTFGSLHDMHNVEVLDISRNSIGSFDPAVFHECSELKTLIIDYNHIEKLNLIKMADIMPKLKKISLGANALLCTDIIQAVTYLKRHSLLKVTSSDKVYYENNVDGIKCSLDDNKQINNETDKANQNKTNVTNIYYITYNNKTESEYENHMRGYTDQTVWNSISTICIIALVLLLVCFYLKYRQTSSSVKFYQIPSALEMSETNIRRTNLLD